MAFETGPYLKTAAFCEKVLREVDNVISVIRIIDRVTITAQGPQAPDTMPKTSYSLTAIIVLVSGSSRGRHEVSLTREDPSGLMQDTPFKASIQMEGEDRSQNIVINMQMNLEMEGLYWFHLKFDDVLITKMPFRVIYARIASGASPFPSR